MPTYLALADELEAGLRSAPAGERVASEQDLVREHAVSRLTARAALQELERRNLVRRVRGAGTFVARRIEYRISADMPPSWSDTVRRAGGTPRHELLATRSERPATGVRAALELPADARVCVVARRGWVDGEVATVATSYVCADAAPGLHRRHSADGSLYRTLAEHYGLRLKRLWSEAELAIPPDDVARLLGFEGRPPSWSIRSVNIDAADGRRVEMAESWMRADVFRVVFELGRPPKPERPGKRR